MDRPREEAPPPHPVVRPKRRVYLVDRRFQLKYTFLLSGAGLGLALVFGLWVWQAHRQSVEVAVTDPGMRAVLEAGDRELLLVFLGIAVSLSAALGIVGLVLTHHVAGPVHVMSHYLSQLAEGRFPRMRPLRRADELKDFFGLFQRAVEALREREARHAEAAEEVVRQLRRVLPVLPELEPAVQALEGLVREERDAVGSGAGGPALSG
ncbi:MAG TPA: hypothetical protein VMT17_00215 [Anaeromyxobacteraceae bacterium]|nr:hypothetical protein [Anaeromyxobacteraceae bacterium]